MERSQILRNIRRIFHRDRRGSNPKSLIWERKLAKLNVVVTRAAFQKRLEAFYRSKGMSPPRPISRSKRREPPTQKWQRYKQQLQAKKTDTLS